ncbi:fatty acid-binding protein, intestinal [Lingula anatina]|uniref:Fatty acid-binding protein, intestinal n=1 Tax=Lingula anatina TaxID=7574 RepID=A0A1S3HUC8_LINAN|nr:fatty acid-binding protein, intestinal [Lingula anatina]|eukprot:XP_013389647.1 fatty acid-binding protein, intestinal [Lingula anatina]
MPCDLSGVWKHDRSENLDGFLGALGMNALKRKMAMQVTPVIDIKQDGDKFVVKTSGGPKTNTMEFTVGNELETEMFDHKMKLLSSWDGNKLMMNFTPVKEWKGPMVVSREIVADEMVQTMVVGGVTCKRFFKKQ